MKFLEGRNPEVFAAIERVLNRSTSQGTVRLHDISSKIGGSFEVVVQPWVKEGLSSGATDAAPLQRFTKNEVCGSDPSFRPTTTGIVVGARVTSNEATEPEHRDICMTLGIEKMASTGLTTPGSGKIRIIFGDQAKNPALLDESSEQEGELRAREYCIHKMVQRYMLAKADSLLSTRDRSEQMLVTVTDIKVK